MHVGDFPYFNVSIDRDGLVSTMREHGIDDGHGVPPGQRRWSGASSADTQACMGWCGSTHVSRAPQRRPRRSSMSRAPRFRGVKLHPLLDGYHPDDPMVHPIIELLIERELPALIHCGHPIFSLPWSIEELVRRYPEARIILGPHGSRQHRVHQRAIDVAARNPQRLPGDVRDADALQDPRSGRARRTRPGPVSARTPHSIT